LSVRPLFTTSRSLLRFRTSVSSGTRSVPHSRSSCTPETMPLRWLRRS
jgi:hypothetical protein